MSFQIHALPRDSFEPLFSMTDAELATRNARRVKVADFPGAPCRISLVDAPVGETVILTNYTHQEAASPYHSSHAVYVREAAQTVQLEPDIVPEVLSRRQLSVRAFDGQHQMIDAAVIAGADLASTIEQMFNQSDVQYLHVHNAARGCYAARVTRHQT
jgi:hypothetical protein